MSEPFDILDMHRHPQRNRNDVQGMIQRGSVCLITLGLLYYSLRVDWLVKNHSENLLHPRGSGSSCCSRSCSGSSLHATCVSRRGEMKCVNGEHGERPCERPTRTKGCVCSSLGRTKAQPNACGTWGPWGPNVNNVKCQLFRNEEPGMSKERSVLQPELA